MGQLHGPLTCSTTTQLSYIAMRQLHGPEWKLPLSWISCMHCTEKILTEKKKQVELSIHVHRKR
jgi:hypothetical protein